ncbi:hypothetical protein IAI53_02460 [Thauera sp. CAU 1555]|uniref:Uncharacterized protein n=1 Tax=Thauera sedimentorum TaxID=2767595 RepID=A0ABR9B5X5_9RHOO|nr:hypothetical protein [Thauera sedimentorum]MBC9070815.1 hypothetical protein [Thauera sedimentorum]MBD8501734.1 hypothetical protein [Thauera sedimentorum]
MNTATSQESFYENKHEERQKLKQGYSEFIERQNFTWHLTANFNRDTTHVQGWKILKNWSARVDRRLHGRNFHRKSIDERLFFIAVPEIGGSSGYLHYHIVAKMPIHSEACFELVAASVWEELVRTGDLFCQKIQNSAEDVSRVVSYDIKDIWKNNGLEQIIISTEFAPNN